MCWRIRYAVTNLSMLLFGLFTPNVLTLFPRRVWNTGPYCFAHFCATRAWLVPNWSKLPKRGTPGISGRFLIFGISDELRYRTTKKMTRAAIPSTTGEAILKNEKGISMPKSCLENRTRPTFRYFLPSLILLLAQQRPSPSRPAPSLWNVKSQLSCDH